MMSKPTPVVDLLMLWKVLRIGRFLIYERLAIWGLQRGVNFYRRFYKRNRQEGCSRIKRDLKGTIPFILKHVQKRYLKMSIWQRIFTKALNPNDAEAYNNRGFNYYLSGDIDRAIEDYNKAIAINPNAAEAYYIRGLAYHKKGQYDRAIEDYNKAIALSPNKVAAYNNRGGAYYKKGQHDRAIEDFSKAIALRPNDAIAYYIRGLAYHNNGQYDKAIEDFNKAIALDPNNAEAYHNRGVIYYSNGQYDKAISDFQKACDMGIEVACENLQKALEKK